MNDDLTTRDDARDATRDERDAVREARALLADVTGEWKYLQFIEEVVTVDTGRVVADLGWDCMNDSDARLVAAAPRLLRALADECDALRATVARCEAERAEREAADRDIPCSACHGMGLKYDKYIGYEVTCPACGGTGVYDPDAPRDDETRGAE